MVLHGNLYIVNNDIQWYYIHGSQWYYMVFSGNTWFTAWYYMVLHGNTWYSVVLHGIQ